jgi:hypothetical protein
MGADNLLEAKVVLTSGEVVIANSCQNPELFFALRGGGGGTYGIIVSATMKAFPSPQSTTHSFAMTAIGKNTTAKFWELNAFIHAEMIRLKEGGMQGYFTLRTNGAQANRTLSLSWNFYLYNKPPGTAESLFEPIKQRLDGEKSSVWYYTRINYALSFFKMYSKVPNYEPAATGAAWSGGRLLPRSAFKDLGKLARALETVGPSIEGNPVSLFFNSSLNSPVPTLAGC